MPGSKLSPRLLCYFILMTPLHAWFHYSHFTEEETEVQSGIRLMLARSVGVVLGDCETGPPRKGKGALKKSPRAHRLIVFNPLHLCLHCSHLIGYKNKDLQCPPIFFFNSSS